MLNRIDTEAFQDQQLVRKVASQIQPELFALLGLNIFEASSVLTCLLDEHFPTMIPYIFQLAALAGFGQLLISREFLSIFGEYTRFWYCLFYFIVAISNVIALNVYLAFFKKLQLISKAFLGSVTVPAVLSAVFFIYNYVSVSSHPFVVTPAISLEAVFVVVLVFDTVVMGASLYFFFKPKWLDTIVIGAAFLVGLGIYVFLVPAWRSTTLVTGAVALGGACFGVLGISIYTLLKLVRENLEKKRKRR